MNKSSKRLQRALKNLRIATRKLFGRAPHLTAEKIESIADKITSLPNASLVPQGTTLIKSEKEEEIERIVLNFDHLDFKKCDFNGIDIKALIKKLKHLTSLSLREFPGSKVERDTILKKGPYKFLFRRLPPDVEKLKETEFSGKGRIFYFLLGKNFCIVAICSQHIKID